MLSGPCFLPRYTQPRPYPHVRQAFYKPMAWARMEGGSLEHASSLKTAIILSIIPGIGLLYLRRYVHGAVYAIAGLGCIALCAFSIPHIGPENTPPVAYFCSGLLWGVTVSILSVYDTQRVCVSNGLNPQSFLAQPSDARELVRTFIALMGTSLVFPILLFHDLPGTALLPPSELLILFGHYALFPVLPGE